MRLFRRVPTPFAITYLVSSLLRESVQKRKEDKYAAQAVHYYKPGESPYPSRTVGTLEEELQLVKPFLVELENVNSEKDAALYLNSFQEWAHPLTLESVTAELTEEQKLIAAKMLKAYFAA